MVIQLDCFALLSFIADFVSSVGSEFAPAGAGFSFNCWDSGVGP